MTSQKYFKSWFHILGAAFAYFFFISIISLVFTTGTAKAATPADISSDTRCAWEADSYITCGEGVEFFFDLNKSVALGQGPLFKRRIDGQWVDSYLILNESGDKATALTDPAADKSSGTGLDIIERQKRAYRWGGLLNPNTNKLDGGWRQVDDWQGDVNADGEYPALNADGKKFYFMCGLETKAGERCFAGRDGFLQQPTSAAEAEKISQWKKAIDDAVNSDENCTDDAGAIGFVLCPIMKATNSAVNALIGGDGSGKGFLVELLTIKPLNADQADPIYRAWEGIRNIALGLYIIVFVLIIFGNGIGYDPYTIKRALPRLAVGVLLTFASFFILQTLVDLFNIIGNAVPSFIASLSGQTGVASYSLQFDFMVGSAAIILWIVLLFVALGALLIGVAGLITRVIIIYALVLLAPLAFLAWVLPNTENMFKKWWKNLIKVLMMFPIVTGMLALSIFLQNVILNANPNGTLSADTAAIVAAVAPLIAIIMIPKTFKWGGEAFAAAAGFMAAKATTAKGWGTDKTMSGAKGLQSRTTAGLLNKSAANAEKASDDNFTGSKRRASLASRAQKAAAIGLAGGVTAGKGQRKAARLAAGYEKEQGEIEAARSKYMGSKQVEKELLSSAEALRSNPSSAKNRARFSAALERSVQAKNEDGILKARAAISGGTVETDASGKVVSGVVSGGNKTGTDAWNTLAGPHLGDIGKFAPDAGFASIDDATGSVKSFDIKSVAPTKMSEWKGSTIERMSRAGHFNSLTSGQIDQLNTASVRSNFTADQLDKLSVATNGAVQNSSFSGYTNSGQQNTGSTGGSGSTPAPPPPGPSHGPTTGGTTPPSPPPPPMPGPPPAPRPGPTTPPPYTGPAAPWQPAPPTGRPGSPVRGMAGTTMNPGTSVSPPSSSSSYDSGGFSGSTSSPPPTTSGSGGSTTIVNNTSVSQVFQQSGSLRTQMASGGGLDGYNDIMRKMDNIDAKLASGRVDTFALKKDLKTLRLARNAAPESMHGQFDEYMRGVERSAGIEENAGEHDVDIDGAE